MVIFVIIEKYDMVKTVRSIKPLGADGHPIENHDITKLLNQCPAEEYDEVNGCWTPIKLNY